MIGELLLWLLLLAANAVALVVSAVHIDPPYRRGLTKTYKRYTG